MQRIPHLVSPFSNTGSHCGDTPAPHLPSERDWLRTAGSVVSTRGHPSGPTGASTPRFPTRRVCSRTAIPVAVTSATRASLARSAADGCGVLHAVRRNPNTGRAR